MMRIAVILFALALAGAARAEVRELEKRIAALMRPYVEGGWCDSLVVGVLEGGNQTVFGGGECGKGKPDQDTIYEIGSVTKTFTGLLVADMVRRGKLNPEAPVAGLLPGLQLPSFEGRAITIADLVTHSAALPPFLPNMKPADWKNPYKEYTGHQMLEGLKEVKLERKPGEKYQYSNVAYGLLGFLLAQKEGKSYPELVRERIFAPLKMGDASIGNVRDLSRFARGRNADGLPEAPWDFQVMDAAGAIRSPVRDVMLWVAANMAPGNDELGKSIVFAQKPLRTADDGQVAYGWHVAKSGLIWHNGQTGGHHAFAGFRRDKKVGVVVLSGTATMVADQLGLAILAELTGEPFTAPPLKVPVALDPKLAPGYAGRYKIAPDQELVVKWDGTRLTLQVPPQQPVGLYREKADAEDFFFKVVDAGVTFHRNAAGKIEKLTLHQHGDHPAPKVD